MQKIKTAVVGVGNCASSLIQGIHYYQDKNGTGANGLMHDKIGGYKAEDIRVVSAFDVDQRKVGRDLFEAVFSEPNCTQVFHPLNQASGVKVQMGKILDGISEHMSDHEAPVSFLPSEQSEPSQDDVVNVLKSSGAEVLLNYLPVGSEEATRFYADCALKAGAAFINCIPVFIASDPQWAQRFKDRNLPLIGDDIKSQLGATIVHRTLTDLFRKRGVRIDRAYQLNFGGNTDFLNMLNQERLESKKRSKTEAVQSVTGGERMKDADLHVGPSDYVPWQKDNKVCYVRVEGRLFGDIPMNLEVRLSVEDSPNSAGVAIDAVRCAKLALDQGVGGVLPGPSAYFCKHPPLPCTDNEAYHQVEQFINGQPILGATGSAQEA